MKGRKMCEDIFMNNIMKDSTEYDKKIQSMARWLSRGDRSLAEELRSEMHIAIMSMEAGKAKHTYLRAARYKAIDYLRSRARNYSYAGAIKHVSLEAMTDAGFQIDTDRNVYAPTNGYSTHVEDTNDSE